MVGKRLHQRTVSSTSSSFSSAAPTKPDATTSDLSKLAPKPCITCGRVITPRSKWAKNWDEIKTCSDRCRDTKPGKVVAIWQPPRPVQRNPEATSMLTRMLQDVEGQQGKVKVDIDAWIEACIVGEATEQGRAKKRKSETRQGVKVKAKGKGGGDELSRLEDVEVHLVHEATELLRSPSSPGENGTEKDNDDHDGEQGRRRISAHLAQHPLWTTLDSPPGLRERVRRAARRLALGLSNHSGPLIELSLQNGKVLRTLEDFSFAKGPLSLRAPKS